MWMRVPWRAGTGRGGGGPLIRVAWVLLLGALCLCVARAQDPQTPGASGGLASVSPEVEVGVDEHLGAYLPLDLTFQDEQGDTVALSEIIDKPTILTLVYYRCPGICSPLLSGVVDVLEKIELEPGVDYEVLTISFDPTEDPGLAVRKKENFLRGFHEPFPQDAWRWMVGDSAAIATLTDAVGFRYKPRGIDFDHPGVLTILSADGKIVRYLNGITFLPFDVKMALMEAAEGKVGPTINRILLYCFSYEREGGKYVFNLLKVTGTLFMVFAVAFATFLVISSRSSRKEK
jgi:protein SCO1